MSRKKEQCFLPNLKDGVSTPKIDEVQLIRRILSGDDGAFDNGASWEIVCVGYFGNAKLIIVDNVLYVVVYDWNTPRVLRLSTERDELIPVHGIPDFDGESLVLEFWTEAHFEELKQADLAVGRPVIKNVRATYYLLDVYGGGWWICHQ